MPALSGPVYPEAPAVTEVFCHSLRFRRHRSSGRWLKRKRRTKRSARVASPARAGDGPRTSTDHRHRLRRRHAPAHDMCIARLTHGSRSGSYSRGEATEPWFRLHANRRGVGASVALCRRQSQYSPAPLPDTGTGYTRSPSPRGASSVLSVPHRF